MILVDDVIDGADVAQQPVGRVGKPEDIAEMVMFLCSDKAGFRKTKLVG